MIWLERSSLLRRRRLASSESVGSPRCRVQWHGQLHLCSIATWSRSYFRSTWWELCSSHLLWFYLRFFSSIFGRSYSVVQSILDVYLDLTRTCQCQSDVYPRRRGDWRCQWCQSGGGDLRRNSTDHSFRRASDFSIQVRWMTCLRNIRRDSSFHRLNEQSWSPALPFLEFMRLLSNVTAIRIHATFGVDDAFSFLGEINLGHSTPSTGLFPVGNVETCSPCPQGYYGERCEYCAIGYRRQPAFGGPFASCVPCHCHNHSFSCDVETGRCACQHHTTGDNCERCLPGYYGQAHQGTPDDCQKCPCPTGVSCTQLQLPVGHVVCLNCPAGYTGRESTIGWARLIHSFTRQVIDANTVMMDTSEIQKVWSPVYDALVNYAVAMEILIRISSATVIRKYFLFTGANDRDRLYVLERPDIVYGVQKIPLVFIARSACRVIGAMPYRISSVMVNELELFFCRSLSTISSRFLV